MKKKIISMSAVVILIAAMAGVLIFQSGGESEYDENEAAVPGPSTVSLISREEAEVREIIFLQDGVMTTLTPFTNEFGVNEWEYSGGAGYVINPMRTWDKARGTWQLTATGVAHEDTSELNLSDFGLDPPQTIIEVVFTDDSRHVLRVGTQTIDMLHYFLMIDDDPAMYLINFFVGGRLLMELSDMIDTRLPDFNFEWTRYVRIAERGSPEIVLDQTNVEHPALVGLEETGWFLMMHRPQFGMMINFWLIENMLEELGQLRLRLVDMHPENLEDFGFSNPLLEFEFRNNWEEVHLIFGNIFEHNGFDHVYVKFADRPHLFKTELGQINSLLGIHAFNLVERFMAPVNIVNVESVIIESPNPDNVFELIINHPPDGGHEIRPTINGVSVEEQPFRTIYRTLIGLTFDSSTEAFAPPTGTPYITITFRMNEDYEGPGKEIRLFEYNPSFFAVSINGKDIWLLSGRRGIDVLFAYIRDAMS